MARGALMPGWMPLVYGRTRDVDRWWRVLPAGLDREFAERAVMAVTSGGRGLEDRPRFLLAQNDHHRLVGGACLARELSETMHSDGRRALYCFVGWAAERCDDDGLLAPTLDDLTASFQSWAAPVYAHWMGLDWELHESQEHGAHESASEPPPWPDPAPVVAAPAPPVPASAAAAWPERQAGEAWDVIRGGPDSGLLATGWQQLGDANAEAGVWIAAADVEAFTVLDRHEDRPPAAPRRRPDPAPARGPQMPRGGIPNVASLPETQIQDAWSRVGQLANEDRAERHRRQRSLVHRTVDWMRPKRPREPAEDDDET